MRGFLKENKDTFARIDTELRKKLGIKALTDADIPEVPEAGPELAVAAVKGKRG